MHIEKRLTGNDVIRLSVLEALFIAFCLLPFIIPNPIVVTNIQPYAAIFGTMVIFQRSMKFSAYSFEFLSILTFIVALMVFVIGEISVSAIRALYNYYAVMIVPLATIVTFRSWKRFPEKLVKALITIWFLVSSVQFFIYRGFLTQIIGGVRWSESYRGVVGLASEPSFLGIACFYFLHMIRYFKTKKLVFTLMTLVMGVVYAQSAMGVLFIAAYFAVYLLDEAKGWRGILIWLAAVLAIVIFIVLLNTVLVGTRLHALYESFMEGGMESLTEDSSTSNRINSMQEAMQEAFGNYLLPKGFQGRIGSGFGGFLCELGLFSIPILIGISHAMSWTFEKKVTKVLYFIVVTLLLFNNTQLGNPLLLFVVGANMQLRKRKTELAEE